MDKRLTMNKPYSTWKGVPLESLQAWDEVFNSTQETLNLSSPCPVCGMRTLHRWYQIHIPEERIVQGKHFIARGGLWQWCSSCRSYLHASAFVPDWWKSDLRVDETKLTSEPEMLEQALQASSMEVTSDDITKRQQ